MDKKVGMYSSILTLAAVLGFAASMAAGSDYWSYFSSLFIAWGFVPMVCALAASGGEETKAAGYAAVAFAAIYAVVVGLVYFAQLTTVHMSKLAPQVSAILDYSHLGSLFFNYDLFGYGFMALATVFSGLAIKAVDKADKWLKGLLLGHGIFTAPCIALPMLGVFKPDMAGGDIIGILVLEFWCAYFIPVCMLAFGYFRKLPLP